MTNISLIASPALVRFVLCGLMGLCSLSVDAESNIQTLLENKKLAINVWLEPAEDIIATQQVNLNIEVSTHRWFVGGTQLGRLEVDNAIVLRRDAFAVNSSRRQAGENWAVQLWTITLYPQRSGSFNVPSIPVTVTVSGEDNQPMKGVIETEMLTFNAVEPAELKDKKDWVATTLFEVNDQFDKDSVGLKKGDAIQRTLHFKAENTAAMMLPELSVNEIDGMGVYPKPAAIEDTVNRGEYLAERTETINYVIEKEGEYRLPALTFYWWDLNSSELKTIDIPERLLSTSGSAESTIEDSLFSVEAIIDKFKNTMPITAFLVLILIVTGIAFTVVKRRNKTAGKCDTPKKLEKKFVEACQQQHYLVAVSLLYQWFDHQALAVDIGSTIEPIRQWLKEMDDQTLEAEFNELMASTFSESSQVIGVANTEEKRPFDTLLKQLKRRSSGRRRFLSYARAVDLRLN